jgi:hypothetical protein
MPLSHTAYLTPYPSSAPPLMMWSTPVVKVSSEAIDKQSRPFSMMVPFRCITCTLSPASLAAIGSFSPSKHDFHNGVQRFPGEQNVDTHLQCEDKSCPVLTAKRVNHPRGMPLDHTHALQRFKRSKEMNLPAPTAPLA